MSTKDMVHWFFSQKILLLKLGAIDKGAVEKKIWPMKK